MLETETHDIDARRHSTAEQFQSESRSRPKFVPCTVLLNGLHWPRFKAPSVLHPSEFDPRSRIGVDQPLSECECPKTAQCLKHVPLREGSQLSD